MKNLCASMSLSFRPLLSVLPILSLSWSCQNSQNHSFSKAETSSVQTLHCDFASAKTGEVTRFASLMQAGLGKNPQTLALKNEKKPGATILNPRPEEADSFIRAASGVRLLPDASGSFKLFIAQDSRRKIGVAELASDFAESGGGNLDAQISMIPIDSSAQIAELEDDQRDYETYRKAYKIDFEASTTLPNGEMLFVGSGSDVLQHNIAGKSSYRSQARVLNAAGVLTASYDLLAFYLHVNAMKDVVGEANQDGPAQINFEGLAIRPEGKSFSIAFFNRGNFNGNGHNAVIEYDLNAWLTTLRRTQNMSVDAARQAWAATEYLRIVKIQLPRVASSADPSGATFPITLNDALYGFSAGKSTFFIPVGAEAEYKDAQGVQHDGEVTFAGLVRWQGVAEGEEGRCEIFQAPGDAAPGFVSRYGKVEGLAAFNSEASDPFEQSLYTDTALVIGVTDVDSEIQASRVSVLKLAP